MANEFQHPTEDDYDPEPAHGRVSSWVSRAGASAAGIFGAVGSVLVFGLILLLWAADISSCFRTTNSVKQAAAPRVPRIDSDDESRLVGRLTSLWTASGGSTDALDVWVLDDPSINAASLGHGIFVLWTGLVALTDGQIDAVLAHEFAHDRLQHSKKGAELRDVTDFVGQAIGFLPAGMMRRLKRSSVGLAVLSCRNTIEGKSWRLMPGR